MAFVPAIYVDRARCIGCNACSLACKQENTNEFGDSPAMLAKTGKYVSKGERWNEVYSYEQGSYPSPRAQVFAITFDNCTMCIHRLAANLLPACVITCLGITREFGDYAALQLKYPEAHHMEDGVKRSVLFGHLGDEPKFEYNPLPPSGYLPANDCRQCHH